MDSVNTFLRVGGSVIARDDDGKLPAEVDEFGFDGG
jgi:hypothetical protein